MALDFNEEAQFPQAQVILPDSNMLNTRLSCGCVHYGKVWLSLLSIYQIYNLNVTSYQPWIGND